VYGVFLLCSLGPPAFATPSTFLSNALAVRSQFVKLGCHPHSSCFLREFFWQANFAFFWPPPFLGVKPFLFFFRRWPSSCTDHLLLPHDFCFYPPPLHSTLDKCGHAFHSFLTWRFLCPDLYTFSATLFFFLCNSSPEPIALFF